MNNFASRLLFAAALVLCACFAHAQVPVAQAPPLHFQFFNASGQPLANGKIYTYQAGTTTLQNTYVDFGGLIQNQNPILLDSSGSPTNGSSPTSIFLANLSYKFVAFNSSGVFQWSVDNIAGYFGGLLNNANTWTAAQTFTGQIIDTLTDNQMAMGAVGNQTTLDFPPPVSNVTLHFPSTADTMVGRNTTDTLANKTLTAPNLNGICAITAGPGTYSCIANTNVTGTTVNTLTMLSGAPSVAVIASTSVTSGIIGVCVSGCGTTGTATIQQSGMASCVFDGATTAGDYVQISSSVAGNCHDVGSTIAVGAQNVGRVLSTNGGGGTYQILLSLQTPSSACNSPAVGACAAGSTGVGINATFPFATGAPPTTGIYAVSCYLIVVIPATTSSTLPSCTFNFIDGDNSVSQTLQLTSTSTGNTKQTFGQGVAYVRVKTGTTPTMTTAGYTSVGATNMSYSIYATMLPAF